MDNQTDYQRWNRRGKTYSECSEGEEDDTDSGEVEVFLGTFHGSKEPARDPGEDEEEEGDCENGTEGH